MSAIARVHGPGVVHSCDLQWGDSKTLSAKASFNPVIPVVPTGRRLEAPAAVTAENTGPGEITLRWSEVEGATAYAIGRSVSPDGWRSLCDLCPSKNTTFVDRRAQPKEKHSYVVSPVSPMGAGARAHSNTVVAVGSMNEVIVARDAAAGLELRAPQRVTVRATGPSSVMVSWEVWDAVTSYDVYRWFEGGTMQPAGSVSRATADSRGLIEFPDDLGRYMSLASRLSVRYAVKAVDAAGAATEATVSGTHVLDSKSANSGPKAPRATSSKEPTNLRAKVMSPASIQLTWNPPVGAMPCVISRDIDRTGFQKRASLAAGTSHYTDREIDLVVRHPRYKILCADQGGMKGKVASRDVHFPDPR